jgi:DNA repair protein RecO (recombination protein O)
MDWNDTAIVLSARPYGESSAIVQVLAREHGRHAGLVRGAGGKRLRGVLQPGNLVRVSWHARLSEHLGTFSVEPDRAWAALVLTQATALAGLASACAVAEATLPEREPHVAVFDRMASLIESMTGDPSWPFAYVRWEVALLADLGFGLDLTRCARTGVRDGLAYVSPRTGRAVTAEAAGSYRDRLLVLPNFLTGSMGADGTAADDPVGRAEILAGLDLTGFFLERHVLSDRRAGLPASRNRLVERLRG